MTRTPLSSDTRPLPLLQLIPSGAPSSGAGSGPAASGRRGYWRGLRWTFAALGCLAAVLGGCMSAPYTKGTVVQLFPHGPRPQDLSYTVNGRSIHYVQQGDGPTRIVFIHGAPGDWQGWAPYLRQRSLQGNATLIAVDRPGWGQSAAGGVVPDLGQEAALLRPLLGDAGQGTLLVAHSYGGAVAARLAMDYPQQVSGLVLIAPTLSPELEQPRWYDRLAALLPGGFLPEPLRRAYAELAPLPEQLRAMETRWAGLRMPVSVIQGDDDGQVDPRTVDFAEQELPGELLKVTRVKGEDHWVLWNRPRMITEAILSTLGRAETMPVAQGKAPKRATLS